MSFPSNDHDVGALSGCLWDLMGECCPDQSCCLRKGIPLHKMIISGYLEGNTFEEKDQIIWLDALPNRCLALIAVFFAWAWGDT